MKIFLCLLLSALVFAAGCASRYDITTSTGAVITTQGKPHYDKSRTTWTYVDLAGKTHEISGGSVTQVEPQSMEADDAKPFKPYVKK